MEEAKKRGRPKGSKDLKKRKQRDPSTYSHGGYKLSEEARKKSTFYKANNPDLPQGYNSNLVEFLEAITPTEKIDVNDIEGMRERFRHYLEMCAMYDQKVCNTQAYIAIGLTKCQVSQYIIRRSQNPERADFLEWLKMYCSAYREALMNDGKINPVVGIFLGKNYDGLKDQQEHVVVANNPLGETVTEEELSKKYLESANLDTIETTAQESVPLQIPETETEPTAHNE